MPALTVIFLFVGIYGAIRHWMADRKLFWFWLLVFLITGPILNTYMNFKFGYTQFNDVFQDSGMHEVRERDYFFIVSFAFFGFWAGLGLAGLVDRLRTSFRVDSGRPLLGRRAFAALALGVLALSMVPVYANWQSADRSGNFIPPNYARNILESVEENGIIFTNGDNDTFPLWYAQEVEKVRKDVRVVNLSLLNTDWYIRQMRDQEPRVPISFTDEQIARLAPFRTEKEMPFKSGQVEVTLPAGSIVFIKDMMVLDILRTNDWKKPIYFTTTVPESNRVELTPYMTMEGASYRVNPQRAVQLAQADSNFVELPGSQGICIDIARTRRLLYEVYTYDTFFRRKSGGEDADVRLATHFVAPFAYLGYAYQERGELDQAIEANLHARMFFDTPHQWDYAVALLYAENKQYGEAQAMLDSFVIFRPEAANPALYQQLAQRAMLNQDTPAAAGFIERALEQDASFKPAWANLFMIYNEVGDRPAAIKAIERYLERFPEDSLVRQELEQYRAGGAFDLQKVFGQAG